MVALAKPIVSYLSVSARIWVIHPFSQMKREYIEDITRWREDMNFIFEWQNNILRTSEISSNRRVMFFLLYRQKDIDKIDFYSPIQKVIVTAQIYSTAI